ncbi:MAG: TolC family protein [Acidobacteria bacterium]|nr:TolC family protein [Acidobacteriota bacterium]
MQRCCLLLSLTLAGLIGGCTSYRADQAWPEPRPLGKELEAYRPPLRAPLVEAEPPEVEEPTGVLTLRQALALALMRSPELAGSAWEVRAAEARTLQAGLPPNPELSVETENFGGTGPLGGFKAAETTLQIGQVILLGDKLRKQAKVAALERDLAGWDYETRRVDTYAETAKAFVDLLAAQENQALAERLIGISQQMLEVTSERVRSGKCGPMEEQKAKVVLGESRIALERARPQVGAGRRRLAATWGSTTPRFEKAEGPFAAVASIPSAEQLNALIARNPDVARWHKEMEQRRAAVELAKARAIPDLTISGGVKRLHEIHEDVYVMGLSVPLPLFDRHQGGVRESAYNVAKAAEDRRAAEARAGRNLAEAYQVLASSFAEATILRDEVLPAAEAAFTASSEGYRLGKFGYLDVLDAQRTFFETQGQYIEALAAYHRAAADVERLVGQSLESIRAMKEEQ